MHSRFLLKLHILIGLFLAGASINSFAQNRILSGSVKDDAGQPLPGAAVLSADGKRGGVTDIDGLFRVALNDSDKKVTISFMGFIPQTLDIAGLERIDVVLLPDNSALEEVVVIGYGTTKKTDLTGSVASVKMSDIEDTPSTSVDQALQGKVAGVDIMNTSGEPGAATSIRIRGSRSISASNEPLIVVDGVTDAVEDMSEINPDDIKSISVLKDASSTAIYGTRGSNGVIIITTKQGATARPTVTASVTFGVSQLARKLDIMDASELLRYRNDYLFIDNYIKAGSTSKLPSYDVTQFSNNTDWVDEITRTAFTETANLSVSGKNKKTKYYFSGAFNNTDGIVDGSGFKRGTARFSISHDFTKWMNVAFNASYTYMRNDPNKVNISGTNTYTGAIYLPPYMGPYDSVNPLYENGSKINTPRTLIDLTTNYKTRQNTSYTGEITLTPLKWLTIKSQNTFRPYYVQGFKYLPSTLSGRYEGQGGQAWRQEYRSMQLLTENTVTAKKKFGSHYVDGMIGFSASRMTTDDMQVTADGIIDDNFLWHNLNAVSSKEGYNITSSSYDIIRESVFARANWNFKERYYLTATVRGDACSAFAENNKWGFFPSAAFKWNISSEPFLRGARWLSTLALRASAGRTGNDAISAYRSRNIFTSTTSGAPLFNGGQGATLYPSRVSNPDLTWEKTTQFNLGVDFAILKERLSVTADVYYSRTTDLLLSVKTIQSTGFDNRFTNLGLTSNKGVELTIASRNIDRRKFGWTTEFTISHNSQMVEDIGHEDYVSLVESSGYMMYGYKSGYPLNALWGFQYEGVFHNEDEVKRNQILHSYVSQTGFSQNSTNYLSLVGRAKYADIDGDGSLSQADLVYLGQADPIVSGGLQNTFNIGKFKIGAYFAYSLGGKIYNYAELRMSGGYYTNQYRYMLDAWHPVRNPNSDIMRAGTGAYNVPSSFQVHDASYLRFKTLSVSYNWDFKKNKKSPIRGLTLGLTGENIFLWTKYNGFDPDVSTSSDNAALRRVDMGAYPRERSLVLNLKIRI